jgi:hypothetical protein
MTMLTSRAARVGLAVGATVALFGATAAPALALDPNANSSAYGAYVNVLNGTIVAGPLPTSTFPSGGTATTVPIHVPTIVDAPTVNASTSGDTSTGSSTATGSLENLGVLGTALTGYAISADAIQATCTDNAPAAPTGSTTVANLKVGTNSVLNVTLSSSDAPVSLNIPNVASVVVNEHTLSGGVLTINALHITLLGAQAADIIIGHVTCGPNAAPSPAFSFSETPFILGGIAVLLALVFGIRAGVRRLHAQA